VNRISLASLVGLWSRDAAVLRRELLPFFLRVVANPLLTVFVFTYVLPKSGQSMPGATGATFATILVPGLVAVAMMFTAISAVALPLSVELGGTREIEDRVMAPTPLATVPLAKVAFGAFQGILAGAAIFPILLAIPATEVAVRVASWPMLIGMLLLASWTGAAMGLFLGTAVRPQQIGLMFAVILTPMTFLGCVYYPWASLAAIPWLQTAVLVNPLVYMTEGLRIALTPDVPHLAPLVTASMLTLLGAGLTLLGVRGFIRRVVE
jgi:ABC-2 type transport system permease protein